MTESFRSLIEKDAPFDALGGHLDALEAERRIAEVRTLGASEQKKLWAVVKGKGELDLATFVGGYGRTAIYEGKNTLPTFSFFQKRFYCREPSSEVVGYNHNSGFVTLFAGPGYFLPTAAADGELLLDYTRTPREAPPGWPELRANTGLIPGIVYGGMLDYVRYVSKDTVIGAAFKNGKPRNQYFMLTRGG
jgi:hypothetical protein